MSGVSSGRMLLVLAGRVHVTEFQKGGQQFDIFAGLHSRGCLITASGVSAYSILRKFSLHHRNPHLYIPTLLFHSHGSDPLSEPFL